MKKLILLILSVILFACHSKQQADKTIEKHVETIDSIAKSKKTSAINKSEVIDGWLKLSVSEQALVNKIGKPAQKDKEEYWAGTGTYVQEWHYIALGIILEMESQMAKGDKKVRSIKLVKPCKFSTSLGITIGSDAKNVKEKYLNAINSEESDVNKIVVGSIYGGAIFTIKNGVVSEIFIGVAAE